MVRSNSSTGNKSKKSTQSVKMKKSNSKSSKSNTVLGPMDFYVKRTETSTNPSSPPPPPSSSSSSSSPTSLSSTTTTTTTTTTVTESATVSNVSSSTRSHTNRNKNFRTKYANVCGETGLSDVTSIVREWVETELDLIDEDVAYILKFFYDLIEERNYIFLASVIQDFYSAINSRGDYQWKEAFNNIINSIQSDLRLDSALPQDLILPTFDV